MTHQKGLIITNNQYKMSIISQTDQNIMEVLAENEKLKEELELSRAFNERFRSGHEMCEVYKGRCIGITAENEKLKAENEKLKKNLRKHLK